MMSLPVEEDCRYLRTLRGRDVALTPTESISTPNTLFNEVNEMIRDGGSDTITTRSVLQNDRDE